MPNGGTGHNDGVGSQSGDGGAQATRLRELGELLRRTRESREITLEQAVEATKVRGRYLTAIEQGNLQSLPGVVYARGFVRSYADFLGLNGLEIVRLYFGNNLISDWERPAVKGSQNESTGTSFKPDRGSERDVRRAYGSLNRSRSGEIRSGNIGRRLWTLAWVIVLLTVVAVIYSALIRHASAPTVTTLTAGSTQSPTASTGTKAHQSHSGLPAKGSKPATSNVKGHTSHSTPTTTTVLTALSSPGAFSVATNGKLNVSLTAATGSCWVTVTTDGVVSVPSYTVAQGQTVTWSANQSEQVTVGANIHIKLNVNGQTVPLVPTTKVLTYSFTRVQPH